MTKADMIETIVCDALKKYKRTEQAESIFGEDSQEAKGYRHDWNQAINMVFKLKLEDIYLERYDESANA
jgi:hypothetical protein